MKEENGVGVEDLSRMFGGRIFGGGSITSSASRPIAESKSAEEDVFNTTQTRREGEAMMSWFLRRWGPISEGLFDVVDDAKMGLFRRTLARKDSSEHDILSTWLADARCAGDGSAQIEGSDEHDARGGWVLDAEELRRCEDVGKNHAPIQESFQPIPCIRLEAPQSYSTPKSKTATSWLKKRVAYDEDVAQELDIVDDYGSYPIHLIITRGSIINIPVHAVMLSRAAKPATVPKSIGSEDDTIDIARVSSVPNLKQGSNVSRMCRFKLLSLHLFRLIHLSVPFSLIADERLMDISLPAFLNETYPTSPNLDNFDSKKTISNGVSFPRTVRSLRTVGIQAGSISTVFPSNQPIEAPKLLNMNSSASSHGGRDQSSLQIIISALERQLKKRSDCLEEVQKEMEICKKELDVRARRIEELERPVISRESENV